METLTLKQAIRNAIEAELAASEFYTSLMEYTDDEATKSFFEEMAEMEQQHKRQIEVIWQSLGSADLPDIADRQVELVETVSIWKDSNDINLREALSLARDAENNAELYYSALADSFTGNEKQALLTIAAQEAEHAAWLTSRIEKLSAK